MERQLDNFHTKLVILIMITIIILIINNIFIVIVIIIIIIVGVGISIGACASSDHLREVWTCLFTRLGHPVLRKGNIYRFFGVSRCVCLCFEEGIQIMQFTLHYISRVSKVRISQQIKAYAIFDFLVMSIMCDWRSHNQDQNYPIFPAISHILPDKSDAELRILQKNFF